MRYLFMIFGILSLFNVHVSEAVNDDNVYIKGTYTMGNTLISYGSISQETQDGIIILTDIETGVEIQRVNYDNAGNESFVYLADVGDSEFIVVCERYLETENFEMPTFRDILLIKYDINGKKIDYIPLPDRIESYHNHNYNLVVVNKYNKYIYINTEMIVNDTLIVENQYIDSYVGQYQGSAYIDEEMTDNLMINGPGFYEINIIDRDYSFSYTVTIEPLVLIEGKKFQEMYIGNVSVTSKGEIYLNNLEYMSGDLITNPGFYQLKIKGNGGYEYFDDFTILPSISYFDGEETTEFKNNLEVYKPIAVYSNAISLVLNGSVYHSDMINEPGPYQLSIYGVNGMTYDVFFSIYPTVFGITNHSEYKYVSLSIFGEAILNGETVSGNVYLEKEGEYHLDLLFGEEVCESYDFIIENEADSTVDETKFSFNMNYLFIFIIVIGGWIILRKK